jgi:hypothetical protein
MPRRHEPEPTPHEDLIALPNQELEIVLRDPGSKREIRLGVMASLRDLEVLGSAGVHYHDEYDNAERPPYQIANRKARAKRVGEALWEAAVDRCGIEEPGGTTPRAVLPPVPADEGPAAS